MSHLLLFFTPEKTFPNVWVFHWLSKEVYRIFRSVRVYHRLSTGTGKFVKLSVLCLHWMKWKLYSLAFTHEHLPHPQITSALINIPWPCFHKANIILNHSFRGTTFIGYPVFPKGGCSITSLSHENMLHTTFFTFIQIRKRTGPLVWFVWSGLFSYIHTYQIQLGPKQNTWSNYSF